MAIVIENFIDFLKEELPDTYQKLSNHYSSNAHNVSFNEFVKQELPSGVYSKLKKDYKLYKEHRKGNI